MDNLLTILCKGNITVKLSNKNQEREFRKICRDLQKKQGNVMLSRKDSAYSARTAHPFQRNGAPFRFRLSKAQQVY